MSKFIAHWVVTAILIFIIGVIVVVVNEVPAEDIEALAIPVIMLIYYPLWVCFRIVVVNLFKEQRK